MGQRLGVWYPVPSALAFCNAMQLRLGEVQRPLGYTPNVPRATLINTGDKFVCGRG